MNKFAFVFGASLCGLSFSVSADVVWSEDFESLVLGTLTPTNANVGDIQVANTLTSEVVAAPPEFTLGSGNVLLLSTGANAFSAIRPGSSFNPINLPPLADGLTWTLSFDIYIPTELVEEVGGIVSFRWKDGGANNANGPADNAFETLTAGEHHIEYTGTFPIDYGNGPFLPTNVRPFINFDQAAAAVENFVYFDNLNFEVEESSEDPNLNAGGMNFGELVLGEGPYTRPLVISNSGATQDLTVNEAIVTGIDMDYFSVTNTTFPIVLAPGESTSIEITFDPGQDDGLFEAEIEIESDDENDEVVVVSVRGDSSEPFFGSELITNGNFEMGDLIGWNQDGRITFTNAPVHRGTGAAMYTFVAAQEWGSAHLETTPPLGVTDDPVTLTITPEMIGQAYEYSAWYYRPSENGMSDTDEVLTIFRWNKSNVNAANHGALLGSAIPLDTWVRVVGRGFIPDVGGDDLPTTSVEPVWSYRDHGADNPGGQLIIIDDVSFKVDAPLPQLEPDTIVISDFVIDEDLDQIRFSWNSVPGLLYSVQQSSDLENWSEIEDLNAESGVTNSVVSPIPPVGSPYFYRIENLVVE